MVPGAMRSPARYRRNEAIALDSAILAVGTGLGRRVVPRGVALANPYVQTLNTRRYGALLEGLGDYGDDTMAPTFGQPAPNASTSIWTNVLTAFVGPIAKGIGAKIGGHAPAPVTLASQPQTAAPEGMSMGTKIAIGAAIALPLAYLALRR